MTSSESDLENGDDGCSHSAHMLLEDAKYLSFFFSVWPSRLAAFDTQKLVIIFFAISSCASANLMHICYKAAGSREKLVEWIYSLVVPANPAGAPTKTYSDKGFRPSHWLTIEASGINEISTELCRIQNCYDSSHLTMTHVGLLALLCLEDDLSQINRAKILEHVSALQTQSGCFSCHPFEGEADIRFVYAAVSICFILDDFSGIDCEGCAQYVKSCLSPIGGGFGQKPGGEAHAGCTYLSLASLKLMGRLDILNEKEKGKLIQWLVCRQIQGFNGRPQKDEDTCYFFWAGASLSILGHFNLIDHAAARKFAAKCRGPWGGYCKTKYCSEPDPLHSHCVISALALDPELNDVSDSAMIALNDALDIPEKYHQRLKQLHQKWRRSIGESD